MAKFNVGDTIKSAKDMVKTDTTTNRVKSFIRQGAPKLPSATRHYLLDKVPIVQWLPHYHPSWLLTDFIAGLTIGVMLIPQGLAYAKIATIPIENGLYSCWIPAAVAVFMGTSKDLSTGPTSILGLLTAEIISGLKNEYSPAAIASAVAFMVGVYTLSMGLLGLGFLLDYVSVPVLTGFISATACVIGFGQVGSLVGLSNTPSMVFDIIGDVLKRLPHWDGPTCGIGFSSIVILYALEKVGKRWGKKHFLIKYMSSSRAVIVLVVFTLISYLVNKDRGDDLLWAISKVDTHGVKTPKAHDTGLISKVAGRAIAPLAASALEHLAVGKAFGRRNGYAIDQTQELNYLGVTNIVNSFFGAMPVGGAMSRTAVNSECGVKSPLNGLITGSFILLTLYVFSPALYWLPKATLAAIIIMAVIHLFGPLSAFYRFWRVSLADFIASVLCFWLTIFKSAEFGIGVGVGFSIVWTLLRSAFTKPVVTTNTAEDAVVPLPTNVKTIEFSGGSQAGINIPSDVVVARFTDTIYFPNAARGKNTTLEAIQLVYSDIATHLIANPQSRSWSVAAENRVNRLRNERSIILRDIPLSIVVLDFSAVSFIDMTAILALDELKQDVRLHCGKQTQFRFTGMSDSIKERFARANWKLTDTEGWREEGIDVVYTSLERAVTDREESVMEPDLTEKTV